MQKIRGLTIFAFCILRFALSHADYHPIEVKNGGSIRGLVKFSTESPPLAMFGNRSEPQCPGGIPQEHLLVKQENRGIKNVLIVLEILQGKPLPLTKSRLDNKECRFLPHIQWAPKSGSLLLTNSDPALHNVHAYHDDDTLFNVDLPPKGLPVRRPLVDAGLYKVNCDRHPWMRAWIYVSDHPYVTLTDAEGRFELTDVPPGTYNLRAWHEGWMEKETNAAGQVSLHPMQQVIRVKVKRDTPTEVRFESLEQAFF